MSTPFVVQTAAGVPIAGALLSATSPNGDWQAVTDADGHFTAGLAPGPYLVTVSREGFLPVTRLIDVGVEVFVLNADGPTPPPVGDAIDLAAAIVTFESPDVRGWPIGTLITEFEIRPDGTIAINFTARNGAGAWPLLAGPEGGEIQYTLWIGEHIAGAWYVAGAILCISRGPDDNYVPTGPTLAPGQIAHNWIYFAGAPLAGYQPLPGERVAWFVTAGDQRRNDWHALAARSNVIVTPFQVGKFL